MTNGVDDTPDEWKEFWSRFVGSKYVAFDLDGTLAVHKSGDSTDHVGEPIPAMVELARQYLRAGVHVRVITARCAPVYSDAGEQAAMVSAWLAKHVTYDMPYDIRVQGYKCGRMEKLYDDRAIGVVRNEGITLVEQATAHLQAEILRLNDHIDALLEEGIECESETAS